MTKGGWYYNGENDHNDDDVVDDDADDDWPASGVGDEDGGDEEDQRGRQPEIDDAPYGESEPWTNNQYYILFILSLLDKDLLVWWTTHICQICPQPWSRTLSFKVNYSSITFSRKLFLLHLESSQFTWGYSRPWARQTVENCLVMSLKMRSNNTITVIDIDNHWSTATYHFHHLQ